MDCRSPMGSKSGYYQVSYWTEEFFFKGFICLEAKKNWLHIRVIFFSDGVGIVRQQMYKFFKNRLSCSQRLLQIQYHWMRKIYLNDWGEVGQLFFFAVELHHLWKWAPVIRKGLFFLSAFAVSVVSEGAEDETELPVLQVINFNC